VIVPDASFDATVAHYHGGPGIRFDYFGVVLITAGDSTAEAGAEDSGLLGEI